MTDVQRIGATPLRQQTFADVMNDELVFDAPYPTDVILSPQSILSTPQRDILQQLTKSLAGNKNAALFSFFSGAGFLDLGFETGGFSVVHVNEVRKSFLEAYRYAREHMDIALPEYGHYEGNIADFLEGKEKKVLEDHIKEIRQKGMLVGFLGGPPCPDFSVGGKNRGREGDNGKLSATYIELICKQQPDFYLFENVKGLWSTKRHRAFFEEMKRQTHTAGYITTERLVNAIEYGVPQDRDRVILLGFRHSMLADKGIMLNNNTQQLPQDIFPWEQYIRYPKPVALTLPWPTMHPFEEDSVISHTDTIIESLTVEAWFQQNDVLAHANAEHYFKPRAGLARFMSVAEGDDSKKSFKRLHRWRYSPTACYGNNEVHLHPYKARRISAAEALAIQSLPKDFVLPPDMTLTDMFKAIGNGVPYLLAHSLACTLADFIQGL